jgi:hypothetical protein
MLLVTIISNMLQLHSIHLIYLILLLTPGVVGGAIVTWKTRSPWALFVTIGSSLAGSFLITIASIVLGKVFAPFLVNILGSWTSFIDFSQTPSSYNSPGNWFGSLPFYLLSYFRYLIMAPIGTVAGAALASMLLIVRHQLISEGGRFNQSYTVTAGIGSTIVGGVLSLLSILVFAGMGGLGLSIINGIATFSWIYQVAYIIGGALILLNGLVCGLTSAVCGVKLAKILM